MTHEASTTAVPGDATSESNRNALASGSLTGLMSALLGGVLVWLVYRAIYPVFQIPAELMIPNMFPTPEWVDAQKAAMSRVDFYHAMLIIGLWGAVLGISLSVAEFICRRSWKRALIGVAVCGVIGALLGCLAGMLGQATYEHLKWNVEVSPSTRTISAQATMLAILGGGIGLGFGTLAGRTRTAANCAAYGFLAGMLAGFLYPFLTASLLPPAKIDLIIPYDHNVALLWLGLSSALIGLLVTNAVQKSAPPKHRPAPGQASAVPGGEQATDAPTHDARDVSGTTPDVNQRHVT